MFVQLLLVALSAFLADAASIPANVYKQSFTFSDQTQFADLSVYNFDKGLTYTYQYSITARPNRQVTIYFLTNLSKNANVILHDGTNATAKQVDISGLYRIARNGSGIIPAILTSTSGSFFLEVTPLTTNAGLKQDFQALATDIVQSSSCGDLIHVAGTNSNFPKVNLPGIPEGCIHVFRAVDPSNNKYSVLSIDWIFDTDALIYKGLSMTPASKLVTIEEIKVYNEKNIIIQHKKNMTDNFGSVYNEVQGDVVINNPVNARETTMFLTADYLPPRPIGANEVTKNGFMFFPEFRVDSLKVNFLSGIGPGNLVVTYMNFHQANKTVSYTKANLPKHLTVKTDDADQFLLSYSCIGAACTGMYGTVEDSTNLYSF